MNELQEKLHNNFKFWGRKHLELRNKCIGMLPEIYKQKVHEAAGYDSIFEYAAIHAGLSHEQVKRVLSLDERFSETPLLKSLLESGEVSVNKLAKVASIASAQNQEILAEQVKLLSTRALETLVRDEQFCNQNKPQNSTAQLELEIANGLFEPLDGLNFVHVNKSLTEHEATVSSKILKLKLSDPVIENLLELQEKGININELFLEFLRERELKIAQQKEQISALAKAGPAKSPHIPAAVRKILKEEYGEKCSIKTCSRPSTPIHHAQRYALVHTHDPNYMAPFCKEHHQIAHSIDVKFNEMRQKCR